RKVPLVDPVDEDARAAHLGLRARRQHLDAALLQLVELDPEPLHAPLALDPDVLHLGEVAVLLDDDGVAPLGQLALVRRPAELLLLARLEIDDRAVRPGVDPDLVGLGARVGGARTRRARDEREGAAPERGDAPAGPHRCEIIPPVCGARQAAHLAYLVGYSHSSSILPISLAPALSSPA